MKVTSNSQHYLELARRYLDEGHESRAKEIILAQRMRAPDMAEIHFKWAELCEELSLARQARESYQKAVTLWPKNSTYLFRLGRLHYEAGEYQRALRCLRQAVKYHPSYAEARELLSEVYFQLGYTGPAHLLGKKTESPIPIRYFPPTISTEDIEGFMTLFQGREMGYAEQEIDPVTGRVMLTYRNGLLTEELIRQHILGQRSLAAYPLRQDNTVRYVVIRVRITPVKFTLNIKNTGYLMYLEEKVQGYVKKISDVCRSFAIPAYIDNGGDWDRRVWFFFKEFIHFLLARRFVQTVLERAPIPDTDILVEPLLATKPIGIGWEERAILLPWAIHKKTEKRSLFVDTSGNPFPEQLKYLRKIQMIAVPDLREFLKKGSIYLPDSKAFRPKEFKTLETLRTKCPVLKELMEKARAGRKLRSEEKVVVFYTIGLLDTEHHCLHATLEPCPDYHYRKVERVASRLQLNPISCLKIRHLIPEITSSVNCNCPFDLRDGRYPSPLLHVNPLLVPVAEERMITHRLSGKELVLQYIHLRREIDKTLETLKRLEHKLEDYFNKKGLHEIETPLGRLKRSQQNGSIHWVIEN